MLRRWTQQFEDWLVRRENRAKGRRARGARRSLECRTGAWISRLEPLESRLLLTNLVAVNVNGGSVTLFDQGSNNATTGDNFTVSYTSSQVVLTGQSGTSFKVGNQTLSTYTASVSSPISITMFLNQNANVVGLTGDGTATLNAVDIHLGSGNQSNAITMTKVLADSVSFNGGGNSNDITLSQCTVSGNLWASIGYSSGDILDLEKTNVTGNVTDFVGTLTLNQVTISGSLTDNQFANNSVYNSTDATYVGDVTVTMGKYGTVNYLYSSLGINHTDGNVFFHGIFRHRDISMYLGNSGTSGAPAYTVTFANYPRQIHASLKLMTNATTTAPTVNNLAAATTTPTITGTYTTSTKNSPVLTVAVNGTTYTLGTSPQLTSPSAGNWSLNLAAVTGAAAAPLPTTTSSFTVTATTTDSFGNKLTGTGTVTNEQAIIHSYLTAQNLTATETASGLNYVETTVGSGAVPTKGQTVTANYSGFLLNANGTQGTEFDSNVDAGFSAITPFSFKLGAGQVIAGWDEAFALMPVGTVAQLLIPSSLAYGPSGSPPKIPANSVLLFKVTVLSAT